MPLITGLPGLRDSLYDLLENPVNNMPEYFDKLVDSFHDYASGLIPPSTTANAAKQAMRSSITTVPRLEKAYEIYATELAKGLIPPYVGTPPPNNTLNFDSLIIFTVTQDKMSSATATANLLHAWMITGIATLTVPPNTPQPWS